RPRWLAEDAVPPRRPPDREAGNGAGCRRADLRPRRRHLRVQVRRRPHPPHLRPGAEAVDEQLYLVVAAGVVPAIRAHARSARRGYEVGGRLHIADRAGRLDPRVYAYEHGTNLECQPETYRDDPDAYSRVPADEW